MVKDLAKNMDAGDIAGLDEEFLNNKTLIGNLTVDHLKAISNSGVSADTKKNIGKIISEWHKTSLDKKDHRAAGFVDKNKAEWLPPEAGRSSSSEPGISSDDIPYL
jgi:hypothetical protein